MKFGRGLCALWCVLAGSVLGMPVPAGADAAASVSGCPAAPLGVHSHAPGRGKTVALTFDDGPGRSTPRLLAELHKRRVPATFFNIGEQLAAMPRTMRTESAGGFALGNHTWSHADLRRLSAEAQARELDRTSIKTERLTGHRPCVLRPPFGDYDLTTLRLARARHLTVWLWSVDTEDWKAGGSGSTYWVNRIVRRAEAGIRQRHPLIVLHDMAGPGNPATVRALPTIIAFFRARGYRFVGL